MTTDRTSPRIAPRTLAIARRLVVVACALADLGRSATAHAQSAASHADTVTISDVRYVAHEVPRRVATDVAPSVALDG
jgi:hypothetical protein